ncbi:hypothetical protein, partial [Flavobacterium sp.]|uniref:hypothetical protein n=1 Tax=Flavobacterium sp. TaxID=239 RepID=UPI0031D78BA6
FFRIKPKKYRTNYQFIHKNCVVVILAANLNIIVEKGTFLQKQIISILCNFVFRSVQKAFFDVANYKMKQVQGSKQASLVF